MEPKSIESFLTYDNKPINRNIILPFIICNLFVWYLGVWFSSDRLIHGIVCTFLNLPVFISYGIIHKKVNSCSCQYYKKMIHGIYFLGFSVSCNYASFQLIRRVVPSTIFLLLLLIFSTLLTGLCIFLNIYLGIKKGKYINKEPSRFSGIVLILGGLLTLVMVWYRINSDYLSSSVKWAFLGFFLEAFGLASTGCITSIIKYYYYNKLKNPD